MVGSQSIFCALESSYVSVFVCQVAFLGPLSTSLLDELQVLISCANTSVCWTPSSTLRMHVCMYVSTFTPGQAFVVVLGIITLTTHVLGQRLQRALQVLRAVVANDKHGGWLRGHPRDSRTCRGNWG